MKNHDDLNNHAKDHYGFEIKEIEKPADMLNAQSIHYVYDVQYTQIHFLYRPARDSKGLLIAFHGARTAHTGGLVPLPLFRGYDYPEKMRNVSVLSICDPLLYEYSKNELRLSWYVDTARFQMTEQIADIIEYARQMEKSDRLLFFGSSGGGFPAIKYAGIFKQKALLSNSQLMLDRYYYFDEFIKILAANDDKIVESRNICHLLEKYGFPQKIVLYVNKLDTKHFENHAEPFYNWLKDRGHLHILDYNPFEGQASPDRKVHSVQWNCELMDLIPKVLAS